MSATNYIGWHIDAIQANLQVVSFGTNEAHTRTSGKYLLGSTYLITIDDIVVTQTPNRAASHDLYAKALAQIYQA